MNKVKLYKITILTLSLFLFISCGPKNAFENWEEILKRGRYGMSHVKDDGRPLYTNSINKKLEKFIIENRVYLYKKDPKQYYYDRAVIDLMTTKYISSFEFFREYINSGGSLINATLQFQGLIFSEEAYLSAIISDRLLWFLSQNLDTELTDYEVAYLVSETGDEFQHLVPEIFNMHKKAINKIDGFHQAYLDPPPSIEEAINNYNPDFPIDNDISKRVFPVTFIENIESSNPSLWEIEFIFSYYYETQDYERAYDIYKKYYFSQIEPDYERKYQFLSKLLQILYETKRYDELLELYEWGIDKKDLIYKESTFVSGHYWIACGYAQKGDFLNTKFYLQKAIDLSSLQKERFAASFSLQPNTFALVWEITMNEVFDKFREDGRYEEIKEMMNAKLSTLEDYFFMGP